MTDVNTIGTLPSSAALREFVERGTSKSPRPDAEPTGDRVELSDFAQFLSRVSNLPDVRLEKVARVRAGIARGDYETPDKLDAALEKLVAQL